MYGPLACGATVFFFDGAPSVPHWGRWWELVEKYKVTKLYTAPTALKMFMKEGPEYPKNMTSVPSDFWLALVNPLTQKLGIGFLM